MKKACSTHGDKSPPQSGGKPPHSKNGFTLLELLVCIVIIGILASALIPGITTARELARSTVCKSNLRQMIVAAHAYAASHDDDMPPATINNTSWETILWEYDTRSSRSDANEKIFQCPSFKGKANWKSDRYTGYNYNASYLGGQYAAVNGCLRGDPPSASIGDVSNPGQCAVFGDGQFEGGANKFMRSPFKGELDMDNSLATSGTQGFRHRGSTNVAFLDGSVRSLKERFTSNGGGRGGGAAVATGCGFLSVNNAMYNYD